MKFRLRRKPWITAAASLAFVVAGAAGTASADAGRLRVSALVYARSAETTPEPVRLPIPYVTAVDESGQAFTADADGELDLRSSRGPVAVMLDTAHFKIRRQDRQYSKTLTESEAAAGGELSFESADAPLGARMAAVHLERARAALLEALPGAPPEWFGRQVLAEIDFDEGCNAGWDGQELMFHQGNATCQPAAEVADILYHEYGHGALQHLLPAGAWAHLNQSPNEGFADSVALMITGDAWFAHGFFKGRQLSRLRDLSAPKVYPRDARGIYTAAETYSSAWFEARRLLVSRLGPERGPRVALAALLRAATLFTREEGRDDILQAGEAAAQALEAAATDVPGARCSFRRIFAAHGLLELPGDCVGVVLSGDALGRVTIANTGSVAADPLSLGGPAAPVAVPAVAPGADATVAAPAPEGLGCGAPFEAGLQLLSGGELLGFLSATMHDGRQAAATSVHVVELLHGAAVPIPDAPSELALGAWVKLPFSVRVPEGERAVSAALELATDHPFSDDLLFAWRDARGKITEFFKGEEELPIPASIALPGADSLSPAPGAVSGTLLVRDTGHLLTGSILSARLRITTARFSCR